MLKTTWILFFGLLLFQKANAQTDTAITKADVQPHFKGGENAFNSFLRNKLRYPGVDRENNVQGTVLVSFVVEKDGTLTDIKITRSVSKTMDAETLRVMNLSPPWIPGLLGGVPVRVQYTTPISFSLGVLAPPLNKSHPIPLIYFDAEIIVITLNGSQVQTKKCIFNGI